MLLAVEIVAILFMFLFMFIGIWSFVVFIKMYNQIKYRNYIQEKLSQNVFMMTSKTHEEDIDSDFSEENSNISKFIK